MVLGALATILAIFVDSIYGMFILAADIVFVIMLPQLTCVLFVQHSNTYGGLAGYVLGLVLRIGAGEPMISLPSVIKYPYYHPETDTQLFPFRTFSALVSLIAIIFVSYLTRWLFNRRYLPNKFDVFSCVQRETTCSVVPDPSLISTSKLLANSGSDPVDNITTSTQLREDDVTECPPDVATSLVQSQNNHSSVL